MPNPGPGYRKHPEHRVEIGPGPAHVGVIFGGEIIADTKSAIAVKESGYQPVYYVPRDDVRQDLLVKTAHKTYCPFKGEASYWSIQLGGKQAENAVWSYSEPYDEVADLKDYMAFYPNRVDQILVE
jgi:uncharacterized protein (DUF427 family)